MDLGPPPPDAPRSLPRGFAFRKRFSHNISTLLGGAFLFMGAMMILPMAKNQIWLPMLFPGFFALGGFFLMKQGISAAGKGLRAFRHGIAVQGTIASVSMDLSTRVNNKHPWKIVYHFPVNGHLREGSLVTFESTLCKRVGQPVWVLHLPEDPDQNTLYPALR